MSDNDNIMTAKTSETVPTDEKYDHKWSLCVIIFI